MLTTFITAGTLLLCACGEKTTPKAEAGGVKNPMEIAPDADLRKQLEVKQPSWEQVNSTLRVAGRVEADATRLATVSAPVTGRILEVKAVDGQNVKRGEVLATIYSPELPELQSNFLKAQLQRQGADRAVARAKQLLDAGVIGSAELQRRESESYQAAAEVSGLRERLRILGLTEEALNALEKSRRLTSVMEIAATIDGTVLERKATIGQIVQAAEPVFVVADLSHVWLVADVPEQSAGDLSIGKTVHAEVPALPGHKLVGKITFVSATVNPETRTVTTRMNVPNSNRRLKPSMLTTMTLVDGTERRLVIPADAVVRDGNSDSVFVRANQNTFVLKAVKLADEIAGLRVVEEGLTEDDRIVTKGAFHLNNERRRLALGGEEGS
jgi:cobalt-zinc-cadmium efflux system membrane fusion protein